jgi:hypothetical protein
MLLKDGSNAGSGLFGCYIIIGDQVAGQRVSHGTVGTPVKVKVRDYFDFVR